MRQFLFLSSPSLTQLSAFDVCAEKTLDIDLPVEKILGNLFALFVALVRRLPQALFYMIRREDLGQFVVSLYEMIISGFQCCHRFHLVRYITLQLLQFGFFSCISFYGKRYKLIIIDNPLIDMQNRLKEIIKVFFYYFNISINIFVLTGSFFNPIHSIFDRHIYIFDLGMFLQKIVQYVVILAEPLQFLISQII